MEENVKRIIDLVSTGIESVATKLNVAVPHLWEILVKQQYVQATQQIFAALVYIIAMIGLYPVIKKWNNSVSGYDKGFPWIIYSIVGGLLGVLFVMLIARSIGQFVNPEFYAIEMVTQYIKVATSK